MQHRSWVLVLSSFTFACGGIAVLPADDDSPTTTTTGGGGDSAAAGSSVSTSVGSGGEGACGNPCVLAQGFQGGDLALTDTHVIVTSRTNGSVLSIPKAGGATTQISQGDASAGSIALHGDIVVWGGDESIFRAPLIGGAATVLATIGPHVGTVTTSGSDVYFVNRQAFGAIHAISLDGTDERIVVPYASLANDLGIWAPPKSWPTLYWVSSDSGLSVLSSLTLDGASTPESSLQGDTFGALLGTYEGIYVADFYGNSVSRAHPGQAHDLVLSIELPTSLAIDAEWLYVSDFGETDAATGTIVRVGRTEATGVDVVAEGLSMPYALAADQEAVYWLEFSEERAVMRWVKE